MSHTLQQVEMDGQIIWVEVTDLDFAATSAGASPGGKFADTDSVAEAVSKVDLPATLRAVIGPVKAALEKFRPDEVNLELTLGFAGKAGVFIASSEANGQVKLSVKWKPEVAKEAEVASEAPADTK